MVYSFKVGPYARSIYLDGTQSFATIPTEYHQPVKEYAAKNFTYDQIDTALTKTYIDQTQYDETIALKETLVGPRPVTNVAQSGEELIV